jgi:hypothetical protein
MQESSVVEPVAVVAEPAQEKKRPLKKTKTRLVQDRFKMPKADFELLASLKVRATGLHRPAKKSELLRAGILSLQKLSDANLCKVLDSLTPLQAARPVKSANGAVPR